MKAISIYLVILALISLVVVLHVQKMDKRLNELEQFLIIRNIMPRDLK